MKDALDIAYTLDNEICNCKVDLAEGDEIEADRMYDDPDVMSDLLGDRLFDACCCLRDDDHKILAWEVTDHLLNMAHPALKKAVEEFKINHDLV